MNNFIRNILWIFPKIFGMPSQKLIYICRISLFYDVLYNHEYILEAFSMEICAVFRLLYLSR